MTLKSAHHLTIRKASRHDARAIRHLMENNWAVHTRLMPPDVENRLRSHIGLIVEDEITIRAFALVEPQPPEAGLVLTLAIHDNAMMAHVLNILLPAMERELRALELAFIMQIGPAQWLTDLLPLYGFFTESRIITFEWHAQPLPEISPHPKLGIAPAHLSYLPQLLELDRTAFSTTWRKPRSSFRNALGNAASFNIGLIDGEIVAYEWCEIYDDHGHLTRLATHPKFQGQGIGAQMLHTAMQSLVEQGVRTITLNTQIDNLPSQHLYRRFGFSETSQLVDVMVKML